MFCDVISLYCTVWRSVARGKREFFRRKNTFGKKVALSLTCLLNKRRSAGFCTSPLRLIRENFIEGPIFYACSGLLKPTNRGRGQDRRQGGDRGEKVVAHITEPKISHLEILKGVCWVSPEISFLVNFQGKISNFFPPSVAKF